MTKALYSFVGAAIQHQLRAEHHRDGSALWNQAGEQWNSASSLPHGQTSSVVPAPADACSTGGSRCLSPCCRFMFCVM